KLYLLGAVRQRGLGRGAAGKAQQRRPGSRHPPQSPGRELPFLRAAADLTMKDVPVLRVTALSVRKGEVGAIIGPSGCGKTTLLRCMAGLERPDQGLVEIEGVLFGHERH